MIEISSLSVGTRLNIERLRLPSSHTIIAVLGPNGAGKTTLLKAILSLLPETDLTGEISINGKNLKALSSAERARRVSYLPQSHTIHWDISVQECLDITAKQVGATQSQCEHVITHYGLNDVITQNITTLSGGELARLHIARVVLQNTPIILLDEPLANLDPAHKLNVLQDLRTQKNAGKTIVLTLHDVDVAYKYADHCVLLKDGHLHASGTTQTTLTPDNIAAVYDVTATIDTAHNTIHLTPRSDNP